MSHERLRETLSDLRDDLAQIEPHDDASRERLEATARELDTLIAQAEDEEDSLSETLQEALLRFRQEHPNLAAAVRRVVDALADLGI